MQRNKDYKTTYTIAEDVLLWQHQSAVQRLRLRGTALVGGMLVDEQLQARMLHSMPCLHHIDLVQLLDLELPQLQRLVASLAAAGAASQPGQAGHGVGGGAAAGWGTGGRQRCVLVQGCRGVTARDCRQLQDGTDGQVVVEFAP